MFSFSDEEKKDTSAEFLFPCVCLLIMPNPFPVVLPTNIPSQVSGAL